MKNKKYYIIIGCLLLFVSMFSYVYLTKEEEQTLKEVTYNGDELLVSIDGAVSSSLPTSGTYYLVDYDCKNKNTKLSWDTLNNKLNVSNGTNKADIACYLELESNPKLSKMPVGSYVAYVGSGGTVGSAAVACQVNGAVSSSTASAETEAPNSCLGQNAREDIDANGNTYGYCNSENYKYYTTGWRIAYIDGNNKPIIVSAGSPECNSRTSSTANVTYIQTANAKALKYCNTNYVDGNCTCTDSNVDGLCDEKSSDAWAINDTDFYNMTKAISRVGKRLTDGSSTLGDSGGTLGDTLFCYSNYSREECGYNNDLIDNGGYYWFAAQYSSSRMYGVSWNPYYRYVDYSSGTRAYGLRPVISLSSSVYVTGGLGTIDNPYMIANYSFYLNNGAGYINASDDKSDVQLTMLGDNVSSMCISVDSSVCTNYVDFASTYTLDLSSETDGEKIIYVYFKDSEGKVVASINKSVIIDTVVPSNSSVTFNESDGMARTLSISSTGASSMCFSNTSSNVADCTKWIPYATTYDWFLSEGTGSKTLYAFFKDVAGNVESITVSTTCTNNCDYDYFMDAYNDNYIYLMRNDGATALVTTTTTSPTWYTEGSQSMNVCGAYNYSSSAYIWCIGNDNNAYYKKTYNDTSWNKVSISSDINTSTYSYSIYPYSTSYAYVVRSDGKTNRISSTGLASTSWGYGYSTNMATCSGYSSNRVVCLGTNGYYYYSTSYSSTTAYYGGSIINLASRTKDNSWIDMYYNSSVDIIESDGTNVYNTRIGYSDSSASWTTSPLPGNGVIKTCTSSGYSTYNYCLTGNGGLYYKGYSDESWTAASLSL